VRPAAEPAHGLGHELYPGILGEVLAGRLTLTAGDRDEQIDRSLLTSTNTARYLPRQKARLGAIQRDSMLSDQIESAEQTGPHVAGLY
jgi:hypothetical protein